MKRNGFTLIELLAVIVITGLIMAITIPNVLEILETSKRETFKLDVAGVVRNLDNQIYNLEIKGQNYQGVYTIENGIIKEVNNFNYSIDKTYNGTITITDNKEIAVAIHSDKFCATKRIDEPNYTVSNYTGGECIPTTPESCFEFNKLTGTILDYYLDEGYYDEPSTATTSCGFDVAIPKQIGGVNVEIIGYNAFAYDDLMSVKIPNTVIVIDTGAFTENNLTSVNIPNSVVYIAWSSFYSNNLTSLVIPSSVYEIGKFAFQSNNLTSIILPDSLTNIGAASFNNNLLPDEEAFISSPDNPNYLISYGGAKKDNVIIPSSYTSIGYMAFRYTNLNSVTIPSSITDIGIDAFAYDNLASISIPNSVTKIGERAFIDNELTNLIIPSSVTSISYDSFERNLLPPEQAFISVSSNPNHLIGYGGAEKDDVIIPSSFTSIGDKAFYRNYLLRVTIPNSVTTIGEYAFDSNFLANVTIPTSVTSIGKFGFCKDSSSNRNFTTIYYKGVTPHDWNNIINGVSGTPFTTGIVTNSYGNVRILDI